jgi:AcrR family transcriptional regulator
MFSVMETRPYRLRKRLEQQQETRQRIVEAAQALHEEVGPLATTISAIAERAGVQRLTVYRHFPKERGLYQACSAHWNARHPLPDPSTWASLGEPRGRLRAALRALYSYYRSGAGMLTKVLRDAAEIPAVAEVLLPFGRYLRQQANDLARAWPASRQERLRRAAIVHALAFDTWRSLSAQGLSDAEAAELMVGMVTGIRVRQRAVGGSRVQRER